MSPRIKGGVMLMVASGLLAACGGATWVPRWHQGGLRSAFSYMTTQGPAMVEVVGRPPGRSQAEFDAWAVAAFARGNPYPGTRLAVLAPGAPIPSYRFVLAFDPAPTTDAAALCERRAPPSTRATGSGTRVLAVFCSPLRAMAEVEAAVPGDASELARLLAHSFTFLVPIEDDPPPFGPFPSI